jgi:hypothetical protein
VDVSIVIVISAFGHLAVWSTDQIGVAVDFVEPMRFGDWKLPILRFFVMVDQGTEPIFGRLI